MVQNELFGVVAQVVGMEVYYDFNFYDEGIDGKLTIHPKWSKTPKRDGSVHLVIDECSHDVVPELIREAWDGLASSDPGYYVPRWVKDHLQKYERASEGKLQD